MTGIAGEGADAGRAPSIRDVARLAGVSHQTVSRVLNSHPSLRDDTRQRVLEAMETLRYRPNRAARALVTSRSGTIGVLTADNRVYYGPSRSVLAVEEAARTAGYTVVSANIADGDGASVTAAVDHLLDQAVEGIVVVAPQQDVVDRIAELAGAVPWVTLQSTERNESRVLSVDQIAGARAAARHLIDLGHRAIAYIAGPPGWFESEARSRGVREELRTAGLDIVGELAGDWTAEHGYEAATALLAAAPVTAILAANDQAALGALHAIRDAGLECPADVSVVGFDDVPEAAHYLPPLTTVRQDFEELGRRCVELLLGDAAGDVAPVVPNLVVRASTGPAKTARA